MYSLTSPTPPTKPTPPTPPSVTTTTSTTGNSSATVSPGGTSPAKADISITDKGADSQAKSGQSNANPATPSEKTGSATNSVVSPADTAKVPPAASSGFDKEITTNAAIPAALPKGKDNSQPGGFVFYLWFIIVIAAILVLIHLWKSHKPKSRNIIDTTSGTSQKLTDLISTPGVASAGQTIVKEKPSPKAKSNFEIRV